MNDPDAKAARIVADVGGEAQLGRTAWVKSAGEYPPLQPLAKGVSVTAEKAAPLPPAAGAPATRPLEGYTICDFANVIAGPACGRMFAELGATVYKLGPGIPQHGPMVMMVWQAELHQGKKSIILDVRRTRSRTDESPVSSHSRPQTRRPTRPARLARAKCKCPRRTPRRLRVASHSLALARTPPLCRHARRRPRSRPRAT